LILRAVCKVWPETCNFFATKKIASYVFGHQNNENYGEWDTE